MHISIKAKERLILLMSAMLGARPSKGPALAVC